MAAGLTLDAGALIAAERRDRQIWALFRRAVERGAPVTVPAAVLAQIWRGNSPMVVRLLRGCEIEVLDESSAKSAGELLGKSRTADIIDGVVALGAHRRGDAVVTSDPDDMRRLLEALRSQSRILPI